MTLTWFFADDCLYCRQLQPRVRLFARRHKATLQEIEAPVLDQDGQLQVPALHCDHEAVGGMLLLGQYCLDALQHHLQIPKEAWV